MSTDQQIWMRFADRSDVPLDVYRAVARHARRVTGHPQWCICARCARVRVRAKRYFRRWQAEGVPRD